jgi:hypothetical protein
LILFGIFIDLGKLMGNLWTSPRFIYLIYCPISNQNLITFTVEICLRNYVMIYGVYYGSILTVGRGSKLTKFRLSLRHCFIFFIGGSNLTKILTNLFYVFLFNLF